MRLLARGRRLLYVYYTLLTVASSLMDGGTCIHSQRNGDGKVREVLRKEGEGCMYVYMYVCMYVCRCSVEYLSIR